MATSLIGTTTRLLREIEEIESCLTANTLPFCKRGLEVIANGSAAVGFELEEVVDQQARRQIEANLRAVEAKVGSLKDRMAQLESNPLPLNIPVRIQPAATQKQSEPQYLFASCNQYDPKFVHLHTSQEASNSACTPIAGQFVLSALKGEEAKLDAVMQRGHEMMARLLRETPPAEGVHFAFDAIVSERELSELEPIVKEDFFQFLIHRNQGGTADYARVLNFLKEQAGGAVLTTAGSSFGIIAKRDNTCVYFDPHGHRQLSGRPEAFAARLVSIEVAATFLAQRFLIAEDAVTGDERADYVEFSPVKLAHRQPSVAAAPNLLQANLQNLQTISLILSSDGTSAEEKVRGAQRILLGSALSMLKWAVATSDDTVLRSTLTMLEEMRIDPRDLPHGVNNIAYHLFGSLYRRYLAAAGSDPQLKHCDFGKAAFRNEDGIRIDNRYKLETIDEVLESLETVSEFSLKLISTTDSKT